MYVHNLNIHKGRSEIVPFIEYMAGRSSGKYLASHPSWYRKQRQLHQHSYQSESYVVPMGTAAAAAKVQQLKKLEELRLLLGYFARCV